MSEEELSMKFGRQRKEGREKRKVDRQRQKQPKRRTLTIPQISEPRDANLPEGTSEMADSMDPDLYGAATKGDILEFFKAAEHGPSERHLGLHATCVQVSPQKNTVLHIATIFGHDEIVKLICKDWPFIVTERNSRGDTALHIAARAGNSLLVSLLVNGNESSLGDKNEAGNTALHEALKHGHKEVAWILVEKDRNMSYSVNNEGKSLLYLAAEAGYADLVRVIMHNPVGNYIREARAGNKSPVHAAINGRNIDVLQLMWERDQSSFHLRCEKGRNPLHCAASIGYVEGAKFLLDVYVVSVYQRDKNGFYPIHIASSKGHTDIIEDMLHQRLDSRELLNQQGQNILHVVAKSGKAKAFSYMLKMPELEKLINERDEDGNTPLHLATIYGHPKIVSTLTWDERVDLKLENHERLTALDIAEEYMETRASFQKRLTWMALRIAGSPRSPHSKIFKLKRQISTEGESFKLENCREKVNVILLVATFVATVTFAAGFTIPGGNINNSGIDINNSGIDQGMATMLAKGNFHAFVISDTMAMYISIIVAVTLIWAQLAGDSSSILVALKFSFPLLAIAVALMSIAFMAGLDLVVGELHWLAKVVSFMGISFLIILLALFVLLCFLASSNYHVFRHIAYHLFRLVLFAFGRYTDDDIVE